MAGHRTGKGPPFGLPSDIVLLATPQGWRHSTGTEDGAMICGRLRGVPADADLKEARAAATAMLVDVAREFHGVNVEVTWGGDDAPDAGSGQVTVARKRPEPGPLPRCGRRPPG